MKNNNENEEQYYHKHERLYQELRTELEKIKQESKKLDGIDITTIEEKIKQLYDIAIKDEKTGLYNFRFFRSLLAIEIEKAERFGEKLSLAIIDIDNFKEINDKFGHAQGDLILKQLASLLKQNLRKTDVIARFGGEEFCILFTFTDWKKAQIACERLRQVVKRNTYMKTYGVTVSIGLSGYHGETLYDFFNKADRALAYAKTHGKDMVVAYEKIKEKIT